MNKRTMPPTRSLYRLTDIIVLIPVSRGTIWKWVKDGQFPQPIKLGANSTAWKVEDVNNWLKTRKRAWSGDNQGNAATMIKINAESELSAFDDDHDDLMQWLDKYARQLDKMDGTADVVYYLREIYIHANGLYRLAKKQTSKAKEPA